MGPNRRGGYAPLKDEQPAVGVDGRVDYGKPSPNAAPHAPRYWHARWYDCCGDCDGVGWGVCCATYFCFPCVFGYVKHKALGGSAQRAVAWIALISFVMSLPSLAYYGYLVALLHYFPSVPDDQQYPNEPAAAGGAYTSSGAFNTDGSRYQNGFATTDDFNKDEDTDNLGEKVQAVYIVGLVFSLVCMASAALLVILGAWNRMQIRKTHGITTTDCCGENSPDLESIWLWMCCAKCALCQEARTVIYNRVEDGVWHGRGDLEGCNIPQFAGHGAAGAKLPESHAAPPPTQKFDIVAVEI